MFISWNNVRSPFLFLVFLGCFSLSLVSIFYTPKSPHKILSRFKFSNELMIGSWNPVGSKSLGKESTLNQQSEAQNNHVVNSHQYSFQNKKYTLTIDMRYIVNADGDTKNYLENFYQWKLTSNELDKAINHDPSIGYYSLHERENKIILTSCINPNGKNTVSGRQFIQNRTTADIRPERLALWLFNKIKLKDERCLWTYMSLDPLSKNISTQSKNDTIRKTWINWNRFWEHKFPREF